MGTTTKSAPGASTAAPTGGSRPRPSWTATVFGLDVSSDVALPFLERSRARSTGRALAVTVASRHSRHTPTWPQSAELVCDQRERDGTVSFRIEAHPRAGYLIWGPTYGRHLLSADGQRTTCMPGECPEEAWQRLLIAQVLPFAALLRGLEVFHASAVVADGGAVALFGPSRAGKTSVALELCRRGAHFLTDDVLAIEPAGAALLCHPGTPVAGLDHAEARRLEDTGGSLPGEVLTINERERIVRVRGATEPVRLGALFFLDRSPGGPSHPRFEPVGDAQTLLSATFNSVLTGPERLGRLLDVCALAARHRVERVLVGPGADAAQVASAIDRRLTG
jgi:hypothetical protein